jgi:hypothetical protein
MDVTFKITIVSKLIIINIKCYTIGRARAYLNREKPTPLAQFPPFDSPETLSTRTDQEINLR